MPRKDFGALLAQAAATLPDNSAQDISPADVRLMFTDLMDTLRPAYGVLAISLTGVTKTVNIMPASLAWTDIGRMDTPEYAISTANGSISRPAQVCSNRIVCSVDVYGPQGKLLTGTLYNKGTATGYKTSIVCGGPTKPETLVIAGVVTAVTDPLFQIFVGTDTDAVSFQFKDGTFSVENIPMRG